MALFQRGGRKQLQTSGTPGLGRATLPKPESELVTLPGPKFYGKTEPPGLATPSPDGGALFHHGLKGMHNDRGF